MARRGSGPSKILSRLLWAPNVSGGRLYHHTILADALLCFFEMLSAKPKETPNMFSDCQSISTSTVEIFRGGTDIVSCPTNSKAATALCKAASGRAAEVVVFCDANNREQDEARRSKEERKHDQGRDGKISKERTKNNRRRTERHRKEAR